MDFIVSLSSSAGPGGVTFDIATADGAATTANSDYVLNSLTGQTIPEGGSTYQFSVLVNGDSAFEPDEQFFVNVSNTTGVDAVTDGEGIGTILNDDAEVRLVIRLHSSTRSRAAAHRRRPGSRALDRRGSWSATIREVRPVWRGTSSRKTIGRLDAEATESSEGIFVFNTSTAGERRRRGPRDVARPASSAP